MAYGRLLGKVAMADDYAYYAYMQCLVGRSLFPTKQSAEEELQSRLSSGLSRKYPMVPGNEPSKEGFARLVQRVIMDLAEALVPDDNMKEMDYTEYIFKKSYGY